MSTMTETTVLRRRRTLPKKEHPPASGEKLSPPPTKSHLRIVHKKSTPSLLSGDDAKGVRAPPSYGGFQNLAMIVMAVGNLRLVVEDYLDYGFFNMSAHLGISTTDLAVAAALTLSVPAHLFLALLIERLAASMASQSRLPQYLWPLYAVLHLANISLVTAISSYTVWNHIWSPILGTVCEVHALVVCLKVVSYALTNRDLRDASVDKNDTPQLYSEAAYPNNLTLGNLAYFWWAPTLVYQPVYPRAPHKIRIGFVLKRVAEVAGAMTAIWFLSSQYAIPILEQSLVHFQRGDLLNIGERLMRLGTVSMAIWLLGFFALFQSYLNLLAELVRFGDREFYQDWWNSGSVGTYWKLWNKPVYNFFTRHIYIPLVKRGWKNWQASLAVFFVSAVLHEVVVGIPTRNLIGVAFMCMILQVPLVLATAPLEKMRGPGTTIGNCIFWLAFFLGQPTAVLLYYFAWNVKYGNL